MPRPPTVAEPRAICARCRRPRSVCYCAALPVLTTATRVVILQHPHERRMPIGTARMASLCLPGSQLLVGLRWDGDPRLCAALADPARPPILLFPGPGARDILTAPPPGPVTLVVVDGTWSEARTVIRDNAILRALPRYAFATPVPSQYRIRREPDAAVVSTIEALAHVLGVLERDPARFQTMLAPLRAMVDAHLEVRATSPSPRYRVRPPRPPSAKLPAAIRDQFDSVVCVVGEANAWPYADGAGEQDELVHWVAYRPATGEVFDALARPEASLSPTTAFHIELAEPALRAAPPRRELLADFARFVRESDTVCSWGWYGVELYAAAGGGLPAARVDLRRATQRLIQRRTGSLEAYAGELGPPPPPVGRGRAGRRAALLGQIVAAWRQLP